MSMHILPRSFYARDTLTVAPELLGKRLIRTVNGITHTGIIAEVEAYRSDDPASHAFRGKTERNKSLFGQVGHAYVYLSYGMHYCLNTVAYDKKTHHAGGVLIRAVIPEYGFDMQHMSAKAILHMTRGPGKVTRAFGITKLDDGTDLTQDNSAIHLTEAFLIPRDQISETPRIGISVAQDYLWRFILPKSLEERILYKKY